jgi:hypothetical protein
MEKIAVNCVGMRTFKLEVVENAHVYLVPGIEQAIGFAIFDNFAQAMPNCLEKPLPQVLDRDIVDAFERDEFRPLHGTEFGVYVFLRKMRTIS